MARANSTSFLVVEDLFARGDAGFLDALRQCVEAGRLKPFAERWLRDFRPWSRLQLFDYLDSPFDRPGHRPLIKRLFKNAEQNRDDALLGAFAVAFDRSVRRVRRTKYRYDWQTRRSWTEEHLFAPRNTLKADVAPRYRRRDKSAWSLFSYHTRYYLRRRAWRYFRRTGHQRPADYCAAVASCLVRYRDADLQHGEHLLDSWSLVHACFGRSEVVEFTSSQVRVRSGRGLGELQPAPYFPELWKTPESAKILLNVVPAAGCRLVRLWAVQLLRRDHLANLAGLNPVELIRLLDHDDTEVQELGVELLERAAGLDVLPLEDWLRLLQIRSLTTLETIARLMQQHVRPDRLTLFEAVNLAAATNAPVARVGLAMLQAKEVRTPEQRQAISNLANAKSAVMGPEIARWALGLLGPADVYQVEQVTRFFDSLLAEIRQTAWDWLTADSAGWNDPALWVRLLETPYDDLRLRLIDVLATRQTLPGASRGDLAPLWTSVLVGVHRGGRRKLTALRQISDAVRNDPAGAERLIPVLAVAIRSVRAPEARGGLAAVVGAVDENPALLPLLSRYLPELDLSVRAVPA